MQGRQLGISAGACVGMALLLLVLPVNWLVAAAGAAVFHELCHGIAVKLCGGNLRCLRIGGSGAVMVAESMGLGTELICVLAGPLGGLLLLGTARWFPRLALCAGFHSVYNLLPMYPLDGGRALRCILRMRFPPQKAMLIGNVVEEICLFAIWTLAFLGAIWLRLGIMPVALALSLHLRYRKIKTPCKPGRFAVQ